MKIALISPVEESVPPTKYGGIEQVVFNLAETLSSMGHDITLFASKDSQTSGKLIPIIDKAIRNSEHKNDSVKREPLKYVALGNTISKLKDVEFDIIHNHMGWRFVPFAESLNIPVVTTLHSPVTIPAMNLIMDMFPDHQYISISKSQVKDVKSKVKVIGNVYNGIDTNKFNFNPESGEYLAFLSRLSPEKGVAEAVQIAKQSNSILKIAGKVDLVDKKYFEEEVKPHIDDEKIIYLGEIEEDKKSEFLGNAKALLAPIKWEEPFGLFMVESLACGTPVIASNRGAAPEIITDKEDGFLISGGTEDFVNAVENIKDIDRKKCYDKSREFNLEKMAKGYLEMYRKAIDEQK